MALPSPQPQFRGQQRRQELLCSFSGSTCTWTPAGQSALAIGADLPWVPRVEL